MHLSVDNSLLLFLYVILDFADGISTFVIVCVAAYAFEYSRDKIFHAFQQVLYYGTLGYVDLYSLERRFNSCVQKYSFRLLVWLMY